MAFLMQFFLAADALAHHNIQSTLSHNAAQLRKPRWQCQTPLDLDSNVQVTVHELAVVGGFPPHQKPNRNRFAFASNLPEYRATTCVQDGRSKLVHKDVPEALGTPLERLGR